jgi:hypothetical protein
MSVNELANFLLAGCHFLLHYIPCIVFLNLGLKQSKHLIHVCSKIHGEGARFYEAEVIPKLKHTKPGLLSMVNCGNNM